MAQGILEQRRFPPEVINPAARAAVDALRAGRHQAWLRARALAFRRTIINPAAAFRAQLSLMLRPVGYKLWRAACVVKTSAAVAAENTGIALSSIAGGIRLKRQSVCIRRARRLQASLVLTGLAIAVFTYGFYGMGLEVFIDGESMGHVRNQAQFERAVVSVSARAANILQRPFEMNPNATFLRSLVSRSREVNITQVENMLFSRIPELKTLDVLYIDGNVVAGVERQGAIRESLNAIRDGAEAGGGVTASFVENVSVSRQLAPASIEIQPEEIEELLSSDILPAFYALAELDASLSDIARSYGMTEETLLERNPHLSPDDVRNNRNILINYSTPILQVKLTRPEVYTETVGYDTRYVDDPLIFKGQTRVVTEGVDGFDTVLANISYVSGREYSREVLNVEHTLEPVTEVIAQGTQTPPTFIRPFGGRVTSTFGWRRLFGSRDNHSGVDFAGPMGSPVVASCDGTVTFSGWKTGYGNCIIISHSGGISTLYGHNSRNLVTVGQTVKQGELIARMGNTGRTTGSHVHFEVRINDKPVNPFNGYIK